MRMQLWCLLMCFSTLPFIMYFYLHFPNAYHDPNSGTVKNHRIPTLTGFPRDPIMEEAQKCTIPLRLHNITIQPHIKWQKVTNKSDWYIFSAYKDNRLENTYIRIMMLLKGDQSEKLYCRVWYNSTESSVSEAKKQELWLRAWDSAKQGEYYHPFLITCLALVNPIAVSVVHHACHLPHNIITFSTPERKKVLKKDFVICIKPLKFQQDISMRLVEWLELQFLLGADIVFLYLSEAHWQTLKVMEHYKKLGKITIKRYKLPVDTDSTTSSLWQKRRHEMIIYNDCFYRHIHSHRYVVNMDLDEAIVPVGHHTWLDMLSSARAGHPRLRNSASISVRNVYFFDKFKNVDSSVPRYMHMLNHVYRSGNFTPPGFAEKSFFNTNLTLMVTNHFALQTLRPHHYALSSIGEHHAHLHHYRKDCPPLMEKDCEENYMKYVKLDMSLWRYKDKLVERVQKRALQIGLELT